MIVGVIIKMHKFFSDFIRRRHKIFVDPAVNGTYQSIGKYFSIGGQLLFRHAY